MNTDEPPIAKRTRQAEPDEPEARFGSVSPDSGEATGSPPVISPTDVSADLTPEVINQEPRDHEEHLRGATVDLLSPEPSLCSLEGAGNVGGGRRVAQDNSCAVDAEPRAVRRSYRTAMLSEKILYKHESQRQRTDQDTLQQVRKRRKDEEKELLGAFPY